MKCQIYDKDVNGSQRTKNKIEDFEIQIMIMMRMTGQHPVLLVIRHYAVFLSQKEKRILSLQCSQNVIIKNVFYFK
jgi:hypothetical protein